MWNMVNCYNIPVVPGTTIGIGGGNSQKEEPTYEKAHISWISKPLPVWLGQSEVPCVDSKWLMTRAQNMPAFINWNYILVYVYSELLNVRLMPPRSIVNVYPFYFFVNLSLSSQNRNQNCHHEDLFNSCEELASGLGLLSCASFYANRTS